MEGKARQGKVREGNKYLITPNSHPNYGPTWVSECCRDYWTKGVILVVQTDGQEEEDEKCGLWQSGVGN